MCTKEGQFLCDIVPVFPVVEITERKQTNVWEIILNAALMNLCKSLDLCCGLSADLRSSSNKFRKIDLDGQCANGVLTVVFQTRLHYIFFFS